MKSKTVTLFGREMERKTARVALGMAALLAALLLGTFYWIVLQIYAGGMANFH